MLSIKSVKPILINFDGSQKVVYYEPESKSLIGYIFTKSQEKLILEHIKNEEEKENNNVFLNNSIELDVINIQQEIEEKIGKIKEIYVNGKS
jgi:hypothetical protein